MIRLTVQAAAAVKRAAARSDAEGMFLRITARPWNGGSVIHGMGFDQRRESDLLTESRGIAIVVSPQHRPLLHGTVVDFVTLNEGTPRFVFVNPNDLGCDARLGKCSTCTESCRPRNSISHPARADSTRSAPSLT